MAKQASTKKKRKKSDSPITVGGGGGKRLKGRKAAPESRIKFNRNDYTKDGNVWKNPNLELLKVTLNGREIPNVNARTRVEIEYRRGLFNDRIRFNEGTMGVRFFDDHFPYDPGPMQEHYGQCELTHLIVGVKPPIELPARATIVVHTRLKQRVPRQKRSKSTARR